MVDKRKAKAQQRHGVVPPEVDSTRTTPVGGNTPVVDPKKPLVGAAKAKAWQQPGSPDSAKPAAAAVPRHKPKA